MFIGSNGDIMTNMFCLIFLESHFYPAAVSTAQQRTTRTIPIVFFQHAGPGLFSTSIKLALNRWSKGCFPMIRCGKSSSSYLVEARRRPWSLSFNTLGSRKKSFYIPGS